MGEGGLDLPYDIPANEYLMINGGKLSKSRSNGGAIDIPSVLSRYDADSIRFYLSINMPDTHDTEFTWDDLDTKINNDLVATLGNYYHRCLSFTKKNFGSIPAGETSPETVAEIEKTLDEYRELMSVCDFKRAIKAVMELARYGNRYFDSVKPWALIKEDRDACGAAMNEALRIVKALCVMMWPFLPRSSEKIGGYLGYDGSIESAGLDAALAPMKEGQELQEPVPVYKKIEAEKKEAVKVEEKQENKQNQQAPAGPFADFRRIDIRVGTVVEVGDHPEAEKLYVLKVDLGEEQPRQIVTNIKPLYPREQMENRRLLIISNLKPAKFRGVKSEGMLMALDDEEQGGDALLLLKPSADVPNGTQIGCGLDISSSRIEVKHFEKVHIEVGKLIDGKVLGHDAPADAPAAMAYVIDGDERLPLGDGKGCYITVDNLDFKDGALVR